MTQAIKKKVIIVIIHVVIIHVAPMVAVVTQHDSSNIKESHCDHSCSHSWHFETDPPSLLPYPPLPHCAGIQHCAHTHRWPRAQYNGRPSAIFRACARDDQLHVAMLVKMAGRKRTSTSSSSSSDSRQSENKDRCQITIRTFERWQGQYNAPHESLT